MKKVVTTIFSFVAVSACVMGLAACKKDEQERTVEVTEEQWKAAVSYFGNDKEKVDIGERNFVFTYKYTNNGVEKYAQTMKVDNANKTLYARANGDYSRGDDINIWSNESYIWAENGKAMMSTVYNSTGEEQEEFKEVIDNAESIDEVLLEYPSFSYINRHLTDYDILNKYSEFTFDAEKEAYCCVELKIPDSEYVYNTEVYFENGKLIKLYIAFTAETNGEKQDVVYECTASYGDAKVTVPQNVKDFPLIEE